MAPGGRPRHGKSLKKRHNVMLDPTITSWLTEYGGGNLSAGIHRLAIEAMRRRLNSPSHIRGNTLPTKRKN